MKIAVVIPCHNAEAYLAQAIGSAVAQSLTPSRIVVVDDSSTDASRDVASRCAAAAPELVRLLAHDERAASKTRNLGLLAAETDDVDAVLFLDADDLLGPDTLQALSDVLPAGGVAIGPWCRLEEVDGVWQSRPSTSRIRRPGESPLDAWLTGWYGPPCSVLWSADALRAAGRWDERARPNDDGDLMMRALVLGLPLAEADRGSAFYRRVRNSLSGTRTNHVGLSDRLRVLRKIADWLDDRGNLDAHRDALRQALFQLAGDAEADPALRKAIFDSAARLRPRFRLRRHTWPKPTFGNDVADGHEHGLTFAKQLPARGPTAGRIDRPRVSVIVPTFNRARLLPRSIRSVLNQTFEDFELLVIDDGSTDDTADVLASMSDPRLRHLRQPDNAGVAHARNRGLREARGRFIAFLDSDDAWHAPKLQRQIDHFETLDDDVGLAISGFETVKSDGRVDVWQPTQRGDLYNDLLVDNVLSGASSTLMMRRSAIASAGFFDPSLPAAEDWEYWIRIARSMHVDSLPDVLATYHDEESVDRRSAGKQKNLAARAMIFAKHRRAIRERSLTGRFLLESARRAMLPPEPDPVQARRYVLAAASAAPSRLTLGALRRALLHGSHLA